MIFHKKNYFQRRTKPRGPKANDRIRAPQVQVIGSDGKNLGTLGTQEAIKIAKKYNIKHFALSYTNTEKDVLKFNKLLKPAVYFEQKPTVHTLQIVGWDDLSHLSDIVFERQWLSIRINANVWLLVFGFSFSHKEIHESRGGL